MRSAAAFLCAGEKFRFFRAGFSGASAAAPFEVTQFGMSDFFGRPRLLAGVPPSKEIAAFNLSRSAIRSERIWSVGIHRNDIIRQRHLPKIVIQMNDAIWQDRLRTIAAKPALENFEKAVAEFEWLVSEETTIETWNDFEHWFAPFGKKGWFRGQAKQCWKLQPKAERFTWTDWSLEDGDRSYRFVNNVEPEMNEATLLREFQSVAHLYINPTPAPDEVVDWLSVMQHYGAPTRMLDWTRSPCVAFFFSILHHPSEDATLWAIDIDWLRERSLKILRQHDPECPVDSNMVNGYINRILLRPENPPLIVPATPRNPNERMRVQEGELLCNLRHEGAVSSVLLGMILYPPMVERQVISRIVVKKDRIDDFIKNLRQKDVYADRLLPGDDFGQPLIPRLEQWVQEQVEQRKQAILTRHRGTPK